MNIHIKTFVISLLLFTMIVGGMLLLVTHPGVFVGIVSFVFLFVVIYVCTYSVLWEKK